MVRKQRAVPLSSRHTILALHLPRGKQLTRDTFLLLKDLIIQLMPTNKSSSSIHGQEIQNTLGEASRNITSKQLPTSPTATVQLTAGSSKITLI